MDLSLSFDVRHLRDYRRSTRGLQRNDQLSPAHEFISRASLASNRSSQTFAGERLKRCAAEREKEGEFAGVQRAIAVCVRGKREGKEKARQRGKAKERREKHERAAPYSQTRKFQKALDYVMSWRA